MILIILFSILRLGVVLDFHARRFGPLLGSTPQLPTFFGAYQFLEATVFARFSPPFRTSQGRQVLPRESRASIPYVRSQAVTLRKKHEIVCTMVLERLPVILWPRGRGLLIMVVHTQTNTLHTAACSLRMGIRHLKEISGKPREKEKKRRKNENPSPTLSESRG